MARIDTATITHVDPERENTVTGIIDDHGAGMDLGKVIESGVGEGTSASAMATPHEMSVGDSAHPSSTGTSGASRLPVLPGKDANDARQQQSPSEVWAGAISRMQTQISYNTSLLESHRRQVADIEQTVGRLHADMGNVVAALNEVRGELRARPVHVEHLRHDSQDLEVLAGQVANVTSKANEVDGLKMQIELLKNRIKRFEDLGSPAALAQRPGTSSTHRELYEATPAPHQHRLPQQPLPSIRTGPMMAAPSERPPEIRAPPVLLSQSPASLHPSSDSRMQPSEYPASHARAPAFRPAEPLPPPSSFSGWRPAESHPAAGIPPPPPPSHLARPQPRESETQISGWAAVNVDQPAKRPFEEQRPFEEEHPSPYEASAGSGSSKRPRLAPIMPRGSYGDESFVPTPSSLQQSATTDTPDGMFHPRNRAPSDSSQSQSQSVHTAASANPNAYRFITSTAQADSQESWRPHDEHMHRPPGPAEPSGHGRARGRGRGGRGRGRGGRGGSHHEHEHHHRHGRHQHEAEELGTPDWEKPEWTGSHLSADVYYNSLHSHPRAGLVRRSGGVAGGPPDRELEYSPATPMIGQQDPYGMHVDDPNNSANKKSRTKPIRNAEGILIRKDGRPDMRSVSSANNLRKVHAKKEAERADMDGRTPTSVRSLAPLHSNSLSDEERENTRSGTPVSASAADDEEQDTQERHQELMSKIFPHGYDSAGGRGLAGNYFPRREEPPTSVPETVMKMENRDDEEERIGPEDSQMTDAVIRDMSEAQARGHAPEEHHAVQRQPADEKAHNVDMAPKQRGIESGESGLPREAPVTEQPAVAAA